MNTDLSMTEQKNINLHINAKLIGGSLKSKFLILSQRLRPIF